MKRYHTRKIIFGLKSGIVDNVTIKYLDDQWFVKFRVIEPIRWRRLVNNSTCYEPLGKDYFMKKASPNSMLELKQALASIFYESTKQIKTGEPCESKTHRT